MQSWWNLFFSLKFEKLANLKSQKGFRDNRIIQTWHDKQISLAPPWEKGLKGGSVEGYGGIKPKV